MVGVKIDSTNPFFGKKSRIILLSEIQFGVMLSQNTAFCEEDIYSVYLNDSKAK